MLGNILSGISEIFWMTTSWVKKIHQWSEAKY